MPPCAEKSTRRVSAMKAEILTTGSELMLGEITDTNEVFLSRRLAELGVQVTRRTSVGDEPGLLRRAVAQALHDHDLVVVSGGLGPTQDDLTIEAIADVLGLPLVEDALARGWLEAWLASRGRPVSEQALRMVRMPAGAVPLQNRYGTAPGVWWSGDRGGARKVVVALPGVPRELIGLFTEEVAPRLAGLGLGVIRSETLHLAGVPESEVDARLGELWQSPNPTLGVCVGHGVLDVRFTARAASGAEADALLASFGRKVRAALGDLVFGSEGVSLAAATGSLLRRSGKRLAVAESCTGGLIGDQLTDVPGASEYLDRVLVVYSNRAKVELLGVPEATLAEFGAVSAETARAMAEGVRNRSAVDFGLAVTGIAGPGGGTERKPVGLVYVALASPEGVTVRELRLGTDRRANKARSAAAALTLLWEALGGGEVRPADLAAGE
ncbi:MAG: competence/damage-inducible protein A [Chitinophagales bacterium]